MNLTDAELQSLGLASLGRDVRIHRSAVLVGADRIRIGDHARIDCFSLISAGPCGIDIGHCVHVAAGCYLFGGGGRILLQDFSGLSSRVAIYTASDDYTDGFMTNPTVPDEFRKVTSGPVTLGRHAIVGASSVILPGVTVGLGAAIGALSCVKRNVGDFKIFAAGRVVGERGRRLLDLEPECRAALQLPPCEPGPPDAPAA